jgi:hypothetical protein
MSGAGQRLGVLLGCLERRGSQSVIDQTPTNCDSGATHNMTSPGDFGSGVRLPQTILLMPRNYTQV